MNLRYLLLVWAWMLCHTAWGQISGTVYQELPVNGTTLNTYGVKDANEPGIGGVSVTVYNSNGTNSGVIQTSATGAWSYGSPVFPVRVEFSWDAASGFSSSFYSTANSTSVRFLSSPSSNVDFGLHYPGFYTSFIPDFMYTSEVNGNTLITGGSNSPGDAPSVYLNNYTVPAGIAMETGGGSGPNPIHVANASQTGSVWGVAVQRSTQTLFVSAFLRRHMGLGPGSNGTGAHASGAIYKIDVSSGASFPNATYFFSLDELGFPTQASGSYNNTPFNASNLVIGSNSDRGLNSDKTLPNIDPAAYTQVGRVSLGDMDISDDGKFLWIMNLYDKKIYRVFIDDPANVPIAADVTSFMVTNPGCTDGDYHPWAVKYHKGKVYYGVICSAEYDPPTVNNDPAVDAATRAKLFGFVYELDPGTGLSSLVLTIPLNYEKGCAYDQSDCYAEAPFRYWSNWDLTTNNTREYTSPILADIEFDIDGSMIVGLLDRNGKMKGYANSRPDAGSPNTSESKYSNGDLLRAYYNPSSSSFELEDNGKEGPGSPKPATAGSGNNEGPGGGEFYYGDSKDGAPSGTHKEISLAGAALLAGSGEVLITAYDPEDSHSGGVIWLDNTDGYVNKGYTATWAPSSGQSIAIYGKAGGFGDVELFSDPAPLEIGNRIWTDTDNDGIQDPDETGIDGITVKLFKNGTQVGQTTTANGGQWYFNDANVTMNGASGLEYEMDYIIRVESGEFPSGLNLTTANVGGSGQPDVRDSDASLVSGNAEIAYTTGGPGENDHTLDIGFSMMANSCIIEVTSATPSACDPATNTYSLDVAVTYSDDPGGNITVNTSNGGMITVAATTSPQTITLTGLVANGVQDIDVTAFFVSDPGCTHTLTDAYDAPVSCVTCPDTLCSSVNINGIDYATSMESMGFENEDGYAIGGDGQGVSPPNPAGANAALSWGVEFYNSGLYGSNQGGGTFMDCGPLITDVGCGQWTSPLEGADDGTGYLTKHKYTSVSAYDRFGDDTGHFLGLSGSGNVNNYVEYEYTFDSFDFNGSAPSSLTDGDISIQYFFCPSSNESGVNESTDNIFHQMKFYDEGGNMVFTVGTGGVWFSGASLFPETAVSIWSQSDAQGTIQSHSAPGNNIFANNHAWNQWQITFHLSSSGPDAVSVILLRANEDAGMGIMQSFMTPVILLDHVPLIGGANIGYLAKMRVGNEGGGPKYYYEDASFIACPDYPELSVCNDGSNTVSLTAPAGLSNYQWTNESGQIVGNAQSLIVDNATLGMSDGMELYSYTAINSSGCPTQLCCPVPVTLVSCSASCDLQASATSLCQTPLNGNYDLDVDLTYTNGPGGNITVTLGTGESTTVATTAGDGMVTASFTGLSNTGQSGITINAAFVADPNCAASITYDAPTGCAPICTLTAMTSAACQTPLNGKYDLDVDLTYTNGPGGNITVTLGTGESTTVATTAGDGMVTATFTGLSNTGQNGITINAAFDADPTCTASTTYNAPADCCPGTTYEICPGESYTMEVESGLGLTNIQWYKDGVAIPAPEGTQTSYVATMIGTYHYTATDASGCPFELCCPVVIVESMNCCMVDIVSVQTTDCFTGVYDITVEVAYQYTTPADLVIEVNGESFTFTPAGLMGTESFVVTGLTCASTSGNSVDVLVYNQDDPTCADQASDAYQIPQLIADLGDLPAPYPTTFAGGGAFHTMTPLLYLGSCVDNELDGQPAPLAGRTVGGDDQGAQQMFTYGTCAVANDDENGLLTVTEIAPGSPLSLCFTATNTFGLPAFLTAWIDWNGNGVLETSEQVVNSTVPSGSPFSQCFPVTVPASAVQDQDLGLRVRLNLFAPAGPTGLAIGGEVEDYMIRVVCPAICLPGEAEK